MVAEGLVGAEGRGKGTGGGEELPSAIVGVLYYRCAGRVNELNNVPLSVADIIVLRAVVGNGDSVAGSVIIMLHNRSLDRRYGAVKVQSMEPSFLISYTVFLGIMSMRITVNIYFLCPDTFICSFPASFRCTDCSPLIDFYLIFR